MSTATATPLPRLVLCATSNDDGLGLKVVAFRRVLAAERLRG
jgi:hypothetical protein